MINQILEQTEREMDNVILNLKEQLAHIRTGRAHANMLDKVMVDYYGTLTPLNQTSQVSTPEPQLIVVKPYDRSTIKHVQEGIVKANLGLNPIADAELIRISIPTMTEELRKDTVKKIHKDLEGFKVKIRNIRRDGIDAAKKNKDISEDSVKDAEKEIQILTDNHIKIIDQLAKEKEKGLMSI